MSDALLVDKKSRFSILVLEDNPEYGKNALAALKEHDAKLVTTLNGAKEALKAGKFDFILSDVHVPINSGSEPTPVVSEMLQVCFSTSIPVCFVTKADHHGLLEKMDEGYISIKAVTLGEAATTFMEFSSSEKKKSEPEIFREMKSAASQNARTESKTPEVWLKALEIIRNASSKPNPTAGAIRKVRSLGMDVEIRGGQPVVRPAKEKS